MAQRSRKQALVPVAAGSLMAGAICVGVAAIPEPVRSSRPASVTRQIADASVTVRAHPYKKRVVYTVRIANTGPDATGRLGLRTTVPAAFSTRSEHCRKRGNVLECQWPAGLEPGSNLTFTLVTWRPVPLVLPVTVESADRSPANNIARLGR